MYEGPAMNSCSMREAYTSVSGCNINEQVKIMKIDKKMQAERHSMLGFASHNIERNIQVLQLWMDVFLWQPIQKCPVQLIYSEIILQTEISISL